MVGFMLRSLALLSLLGSVFVQAQGSSPMDALAAYPDCAIPCIASAFGGGLCAPTNQTCICSDPLFQQNVTLCVTASCTIPESLVMRNASLTSCGAPVRDRSAEYILLSNVMAVIAAVCVLTRFGYKISTKLDLGLDDWFVLATMVSAVPSAIITVFGTTKNGLGKDIWTLTPDEITNVAFYFYIMAWLYFLQVTLVKLSIITFYLRIFPAKEVQRLLWGTFIFTSLWGFSFVITAIFQCWPVHYFWTKWDGMHEGSCASANSISWSNASMNIALDLWILAIPLWQLKSLHLHWKKKIGVAVMFCVGTFVTVVSILRLQSLVHFASTHNTTWEFYDVSVWSTIEICVGIMCACLPAIRMVLVKAFPILGGSSIRSKGNKYYQQYGSAPRSRMAVSGTGTGTGTGKPGGMNGTVGVVTTARSNSDPEADVRGIIFQKSYDVQFSNDDEARLVQMNELDVEGRKMEKR